MLPVGKTAAVTALAVVTSTTPKSLIKTNASFWRQIKNDFIVVIFFLIFLASLASMIIFKARNYAQRNLTRFAIIHGFFNNPIDPATPKAALATCLLSRRGVVAIASLRPVIYLGEVGIARGKAGKVVNGAAEDVAPPLSPAPPSATPPASIR